MDVAWEGHSGLYTMHFSNLFPPDPPCGPSTAKSSSDTAGGGGGSNISSQNSTSSHHHNTSSGGSSPAAATTTTTTTVPSSTATATAIGTARASTAGSVLGPGLGSIAASSPVGALTEFSKWHLLIRMNVENDICFVKGEAKVFSPTPSLATPAARGISTGKGGQAGASPGTTSGREGGGGSSTIPQPNPYHHHPSTSSRSSSSSSSSGCGTSGGDGAVAVPGQSASSTTATPSPLPHPLRVLDEDIPVWQKDRRCQVLIEGTFRFCDFSDQASAFRLEVRLEKLERAVLGLPPGPDLENVLLSCGGHRACGWHMGVVQVSANGKEISLSPLPLHFLLKPYFGPRCSYCLDPVYAFGYSCSCCEVTHYCSRDCMRGHMSPQGGHGLLCPLLKRQYSIRSGSVATEVNDDTRLLAWWRCLDDAYFTILVDDQLGSLGCAVEFTLCTLKSPKKEGLQFRFITPKHNEVQQESSSNRRRRRKKKKSSRKHHHHHHHHHQSGKVGGEKEGGGRERSGSRGKGEDVAASSRNNNSASSRTDHKGEHDPKKRSDENKKKREKSKREGRDGSHPHPHRSSSSSSSSCVSSCSTTSSCSSASSASLGSASVTRSSSSSRSSSASSFISTTSTCSSTSSSTPVSSCHHHHHRKKESSTSSSFAVRRRSRLGHIRSKKAVKLPSDEDVIDFACLLFREVNRSAIEEGCISLSSACLGYLFLFSPATEITIQSHMLFYSGFKCEELGVPLTTIEEYVSFVRPIHSLVILQIEYALRSSISSEFWRRIRSARDAALSLCAIHDSKPCSANEEMRLLVDHQQCEAMLLLAKVYLIISTRCSASDSADWLKEGERLLRQCLTRPVVLANDRIHAMYCFRLAAYLLLFHQGNKNLEAEHFRQTGEALMERVEHSGEVERRFLMRLASEAFANNTPSTIIGAAPPPVVAAAITALVGRGGGRDGSRMGSAGGGEGAGKGSVPAATAVTAAAAVAGSGGGSGEVGNAIIHASEDDGLKITIKVERNEARGNEGRGDLAGVILEATSVCR